MLKKFINWFKKDHEYRTKYIWANYCNDHVALLPSIEITYGTVLEKGLIISWLWFSIWFHSEMY